MGIYTRRVKSDRESKARREASHEPYGLPRRYAPRNDESGGEFATATRLAFDACPYPGRVRSLIGVWIPMLMRAGKIVSTKPGFRIVGENKG